MRKFTLAILFIAATAAADDSTFKNIDVFELEVATDTQISPDGSRIAYTRVSKDIMTDRSVSNIWIVDANGEHHRPLLSGAQSYSSPRWSPSGDRLAFITSVAERGSQIHVRWMDTGQTAMLSNVRGGPSSLTWSPDGKQIAFEMFVKADDASLASPPPAPEGAEWAPPVTVIDQMHYRADGAGYLEHGNSHLFVLSADGGSPRKITSGERDYNGPLAWSKDGRRIYFAGNLQDEWEHDPMEAEIWSVEVGSGELKQLTDRDGPDFSPIVSPDGSRLAYLGFDDKKMGYHNSNVYVMDLDDGSIEVLTADFDRSIDDVEWAGNSNHLYVQYDDHGRTNIATLSMRGDVSSVANDVGGVGLGRPYTSGGFSVANNGAFAYLFRCLAHSYNWCVEHIKHIDNLGTIVYRFFIGHV